VRSAKFLHCRLKRIHLPLAHREIARSVSRVTALSYSLGGRFWIWAAFPAFVPDCDLIDMQKLYE
jgi:hypothetical protein